MTSSTQFVLGKEVDLKTLDAELQTLALPGYSAVMVLSREIDADGHAVLGLNLKPVKLPPYLVVKTDSALTGQQRGNVQATIAAHIVPPPV